MNIALLAHDNKKALMVRFCVKYSAALAEHNLCAPTTTGKLIHSATGLPVTLFLPCAGGGSQQIGHRIACDEVDLVLFFCDPSGRQPMDDIQSIAQLCDQKNIPYATNVAMAEILMEKLISSPHLPEYRFR